MTVSIVLTCRECTERLEYVPTRLFSEEAWERFQDLMRDAKRDGWDTDRHLCPEHAISPFQRLVREAWRTASGFGDVEKAIRDKYRLIPKADEVESTIEYRDRRPGIVTIKYLDRDESRV
jgi:hypothetical protein